MMFGLEQQHWETIQKLVIQPLKSHGAQVWIFGSRARGDFKVFSDLDILYEILGARLPESTRAIILESLVESTLPIKVDLVAVEDLAPSYKQQILNERVAV